MGSGGLEAVAEGRRGCRDKQGWIGMSGFWMVYGHGMRGRNEGLWSAGYELIFEFW